MPGLQRGPVENADDLAARRERHADRTLGLRPQLLIEDRDAGEIVSHDRYAACEHGAGQAGRNRDARWRLTGESETTTLDEAVAGLIAEQDTDKVAIEPARDPRRQMFEQLVQ